MGFEVDKPKSGTKSTYVRHDGLFCPILLHLDITLVITQKYDQIES